MKMTFEEITAEVLGLPSEARALLVDRLVESLDPTDDEVFRKLQAKEALRRRDEIRSGLVKTIPGPEGLERIRQATAQ